MARFNIPDDLKYAETHEWARVEGGRVTVGLTDYAQHELGDIVYVELPKIGTKLEASTALGTVESVKTASDVYAPVSGTIVEINEELEESPEAVNEDPYDAAWIAIIEMSNPAELGSLLEPEEYRKHIETDSDGDALEDEDE